MKATCINGSARNNGSCAHLLDNFISGIKSKNKNAEVVQYCVGDADLHFCKGCKKCYIDGECVQNDDVKKIVGDVLTSDIVLIAAPSYWADVPAQLKTLFDRTTPYGDTNPKRILKAEKSIKGIAIAVRAGMREQENELILNAIEHYFGHLGIETIKRISITQTDTLNDLLENHADEIKQIYELGKSLS
ncbi:MAG: flavodoxin family protein [Treponemataceae bacterium]|nr:flavodoxin family protein [Treponemataceae bacterium]